MVSLARPVFTTDRGVAGAFGWQGDQDNIAENMYAYIQAFSPAVRDIFECFDFHTQVDRLAKGRPVR